MRQGDRAGTPRTSIKFPFLFGGTFIEAPILRPVWKDPEFPFLFGGTFIEARAIVFIDILGVIISLPFRRDFH